jgi:acetyl esterase/lipase
VVVIVHGGAGIAGTFAGLRPWQTRLNAEGYVTLNIDYRLFTPGVESPVFPHPEQNVKAAVQFLRGTGSALGIRKDRIAVQGHSSGARLGAVAFTSPGDPWFAGPELWPGIADTVDAFVGFYHPYDGSMQHQAQYYGGPDDSPLPAVQERWARADSLANAGRAAGPALLLTGDEDWDIQIVHQEVFKAGLEGAGRPARTVVIEGGGHGFDEGDGTRLSRLGEQAAGDVLRFLDEAFAQDPPRPAMVAVPDLDGAPEGTGVPQTTFVPRPRQYPTPTTTLRGAASSNRSATADGTSGRSPTTTARPPAPPPTVAPRPTAPPTSRPPVTSTPTTAKPSTPTSKPTNPGSGAGTASP